MVDNPWKLFQFSFWHTGDGLAVLCKKYPENFSSELIIKLTKFGVYRYSYSYNSVASVDDEFRIRAIRADFDKTKLVGDLKPSFVEHDNTVFNNFKLRLWVDAIHPLAIVTTPGLYANAFCLLAITPGGLHRCRLNPESVVPVDEFGRVRILRGDTPGISN